MSVFKELNKVTIQAINNGHCGIFTVSDLAMMLNREDNKAFRTVIAKSVSNDTLKRVTKSIHRFYQYLGKSLLNRLSITIFDNLLFCILKIKNYYKNCVSLILLK